MDFAQELEQITKELALRAEALTGPNAGMPRPCCGRSEAEHIQDEIDALNAVKALMETGDEAPFAAYVQNEGAQGNHRFFRWIIRQVWINGGEELYPERCEETERKLRLISPTFEETLSAPSGIGLLDILAAIISSDDETLQ